MSVILAVLLRWLHVVSACLALGGVFFMGVVLPAVPNCAPRPLISISAM